MRRRMIAAATTLAAAGALVLAAAPGATAAGGSTCSLNGTANFTSPLSATSSPFGYTFTGNLTSCQSSTSGAPGAGMIAAGTNGLPQPSGSGSCASSTTSGTALITWANGDYTVVSYKTTGATAAVALQGTVIQSVSATTIDPSTGQPVTTTYTTDEPATPVGSNAGGALAFQPPNPAGCAPGGGGVSTAGISGQIGTGSTS